MENGNVSSFMNATNCGKQDKAPSQISNKNQCEVSANSSKCEGSDSVNINKESNLKDVDKETSENNVSFKQQYNSPQRKIKREGGKLKEGQKRKKTKLHEGQNRINRGKLSAGFQIGGKTEKIDQDKHLAQETITMNYERFKSLGDNACVLFYSSRNEAEAMNAINYYRQALRYNDDKDIRDRISKLKNQIK
jgi:hypothetical protein